MLIFIQKFQKTVILQKKNRTPWKTFFNKFLKKTSYQVITAYFNAAIVQFLICLRNDSKYSHFYTKILKNNQITEKKINFHEKRSLIPF